MTSRGGGGAEGRVSWWTLFLAYFRLSDHAICEASRGKRDYHDYPDGADDDLGAIHGYVYHCKRCGKAFEI